MPEQTPRTLNHFGLYRFTDSYFELDPSQQTAIQATLLKELKATGHHFDIYQVAPASSIADILIWSAAEATEPTVGHTFFTGYGRVVAGLRRWLQPVDALWGLTKPSQYTKTRSTQELDPFSSERKPYLVIYPFTKTREWYLMSREARQGMMNEHIRIGKEYPQITQLLLYSFGLQDQEFVVVYETDDLALFSDLVYALRDTEARRFTKSDAPLYTAFHHPAETSLALWTRSAEKE